MAKRENETNVASTDLLTIVVNVPKVVRKSFVVALSKEGREAGQFAEAVLELDMSEATAEAILDSAIRTVVINTQGKIRAQLKKSKASITSVNGTVWRSSIKPAAKMAVPPIDRARMAISGLTPEQKAQLLAELATV